MHQTTRLDLRRCIIRELLSYSYIAIEVLHEKLEEAVKLKEGKASLAKNIRR
jgi:hypothetical protein